jgi:hypothetical protein
MNEREGKFNTKGFLMATARFIMVVVRNMVRWTLLLIILVGGWRSGHKRTERDREA